MNRWVRRLKATPLHPQWLLRGTEELRGLLATLPPGRVLDIGCADRWVERCLPRDCTYLGLDYPATGRELYGARPTLYADASRLPIADASVDSVVMLEVLEHLRCPRESCAEAARVLRPGGILLLSMPFLYPIHDAPHDYQRYTRHGLERELRAAGFILKATTPGLGALETAGLLASLSLGGVAREALRRRSPAVLLLPLLVCAVPVVNLLAWIGGKCCPDWDAMTSGYTVLASRG
ncbi:methyltransferase domain-containing protein [Lysobacter sp. SG-8]|uniref:Methyltransferase domain-containing protein n=1 Tax=Marilutibacter penaei TaxID=2759900 RepID=A0A7W3YET8_9GAMM|nr:methyltransferase domain-containing protein [Lysobacter penaei]